MQPARSAYWWALGLGWPLLAVAGWQYAAAKHLSSRAVLPALAAFLIEYSFYLWPGFGSIRERLSRLAPLRFALVLTASGVLPYLVFALGTGGFSWPGAALWTAVTGAVSFWYVLLPPVIPADIGLLVLLAVVMLNGTLRRVFPPVDHLRLEVLGHLILIHLAALMLLCLRRAPDSGFGFVPEARDLRAGGAAFVLLGIVVYPLGRWLGVLGWHSPALPVWQAAALALGYFWVVALSEEYFFRGLILQWIERGTRSRLLALLVSSLLFGLVHLPFGGKFPNWRFAGLAAVAGLFYGGAFLKTRRIRSSMVTHAMTIVFWRLLLA